MTERACQLLGAPDRAYELVGRIPARHCCSCSAAVSVPGQVGDDRGGDADLHAQGIVPGDSGRQPPIQSNSCCAPYM
jgi:hypothetical protein